MASESTRNYGRRSGLFGCLVMIDDKILPGYNDSTLYNLGHTFDDSRLYRGVRTIAEVVQGPHSPKILMLKHVYSTYGAPDVIIGWISIQLSKCILPQQSFDLDRPTAAKKFGIDTVLTHAVQIRFVFRQHDAIIHTSRCDWRSLLPKSYTADAEAAANGWMDALRDSVITLDLHKYGDVGLLSIYLLSQSQTKLDGDWKMFFADDGDIKVSGCPSINTESKSYIAPEPSLNVWTDADHRVVAMQMSAREEHHLEERRAELLKDIVHKSFMVEIPSSRLKPPGKVSDLEQYGCSIPRAADGSGPALSYVVRIEVLSCFRDLIPDVGEQVQLALNLPHWPRPLLRSAKPDRALWDAVRIRTPDNMRPTPIIFFMASTPLEPRHHWPPAYETPPRRFRVPTTPTTGGITKLWKTVTADEKNMVPAKIIWKPNDATACEERDAVCRMIDSDHPLQSAQWRYAAAFQTNVAVDLTAAFPSLDVEKFDKYARPALRDVAQAPAGMLFIEGDPGSGKTTFAVDIIGQICKDPRVDPKLFIIQRGRSEPPTTNEADVSTDSPEAATLAPDSDKSVGDCDSIPGCQRKGPLPRTNNPPIFWCTPGHALCHDMVPKLKKAVAGAVVHVYPWATEVSALEPRRKFEEQIEEKEVHMSPAERSMLGAAKKRDLGAREDPHSLASLAKAMATEPDSHLQHLFEKLEALYEKKQRTPELIEESRQLRCTILVEAARQVRVFVSTPVSLGQLGKYFSTVSKLTIIDEAARMPESSFWIPISQFPGPVIAIGDQYQLGPVVKSTEIDPEQSRKSRSLLAGWRSVFGQQRKLSVLHRAA